MRRLGLVIFAAACGAHAPARGLELQRVILYQNGIGYFERSGHVEGERLRLRLARGELDDVLKTLTVIDRLGAGIATVELPSATPSERDPTVELGVRMSAGRVHDVHVGYAVPTPTWKAAYRVVLDDKASLLQGWAMIDNASQDDWNGVQLVLATGAPMSLALDLHTPQYVARPDATGRMVTPTATGVVAPEQAGATDRDGDGDAIADVDDKCPDEPAPGTDDGCPVHDRVVVTSTDLEVLDSIVFAKGSDVLAATANPILDAVAATLRAHGDIARVEIGGFAAGDEGDPWSLSARRAAAVRTELVARGVAAARLVAVPYGATRPLDAKPSDRDRRVEFLITERTPARAQPVPAYDAATARTAVHAAATPASVAGSVRYVLGEPVSIRRGAAAMVSILNERVTARDALLFRPDANAPGSDRHPFRAVHLVNDTGYTLEPGPLAIFARGAFVGDSLIERLDVGATAWVPYALEGGTTVTAATDDTERPVRVVSIRRGAIVVESADVRVTHYTVAAGRDPAPVLFVRHAKRNGYTVRELPPGAIDEGDAYLLAIPIQPGKTSVLAVEERAPRRRTVELADDGGAPALGAYVEGSHLPAAVAEQLSAALALREQLGTVEQAREHARARIGELAARAEEVRQNLRAIDKVRDTDDLRKKLIAELARANGDGDALARELVSDDEKLTAMRGRLADALRDLELAE